MLIKWTNDCMNTWQTNDRCKTGWLILVAHPSLGILLPSPRKASFHLGCEQVLPRLDTCLRSPWDCASELDQTYTFNKTLILSLLRSSSFWSSALLTWAVKGENLVRTANIPPHLHGRQNKLCDFSWKYFFFLNSWECLWVWINIIIKFTGIQCAFYKASITDVSNV